MKKQESRYIEELLITINLFSRKHPPESLSDPSGYESAISTLRQAVVHMNPALANVEDISEPTKDESVAKEFEDLISVLFEYIPKNLNFNPQEVYKDLEEAKRQVFAMVPSETVENLLKIRDGFRRKFDHDGGELLTELRFFAKEHLPKDEVSINCYDAAIAVLEKAMIYINPPSADPKNRSYYSDSEDKYWKLICWLTEIDDLLAMDLGDLDEGYKISLDYEPFQVGELLEEAKRQLFAIQSAES